MRTKYPRTYHFTFSQTVADDDKILSSVEQFVGKRVVATLKMDGESFTFYSDGYSHARSLDSGYHDSRSWVMSNIVPRVAPLLPENWRVCGENLYAQHSIRYDDLKSFFMVYSIWDETNTALSWDETVEWCAMLDLIHVPVLYDGIWDEKIISNLWKKLNLEKDEGFVVRLADRFHYDDFSSSMGKWVRENHVITDTHWKKNWIPNEMKED